MERSEPDALPLRYPKARRLLSRQQVRKRYGDISGMTLYRWERDPDLKFPKPIKINGRNYSDEQELDEFDRKRELRRAEEWSE